MAVGDITKQFLSGSTNGRQIKVVATATPGTLIHTAHATAKDEAWIYVANSDSADREIVIQFGGVTAPDDQIKMTVPFRSGLFIAVPGLPISSSVIVRAFCATANVLTVSGYVNRIE